MEKTVISKQWQLKQLPDDFQCNEETIKDTALSGEWLSSEVFPAQVQDILRQNGVIDDPWLPGKAEEYQWISQKNWLYRTRFTCANPDKMSWLLFSGLDTVCTIYLNGKELLYADDSYIPWEVSVTGKLAQSNDLIVYFPSVTRLIEEAELPAELKGRWPKASFLRKMPQDFRDYLGPKPFFTRVGIYGDVCLKQYETAGIRGLHLRTKTNDNFSGGSILYHLEGFAESGVSVRITVSLDGNTVARTGVDPVICANGQFVQEGELQVASPELWWPRGHGQQPLYQVDFELVSICDEVLDAAVRQVGFRRIDSPEPYRFIINGKHITLMGGNFGPLDMATLCWNKERMNRLFDLAENAHFNIMRMWGETGPSDDHFYDECDRRGILVWRDFCNSNLIPEDDKLSAYRLHEVEYQVPHLMHRPCILLWCGGNESYLWSNRATLGEGSYIGRKTILKMKEICKRLDPDRYFVESSPDLGNFANDPQGGNTHGYTNMWYVPGYDYLRFATEDTRISAPNYKSLQRFMRPEELWPKEYSPLYTYGCTFPWPNTWEFYTTSTGERKVGPVDEFYDADDPQELVYRLGSASGVYYKRTIEKFRQGRPADKPEQPRNTSGYIVWKFNDSWPEIYSAKVDYFLEPYISYYYIRRAYTPLSVSFDIGNHIYTWVVNDTPELFEGVLKVTLFDTVKNEVTAQTQRVVSVGAGQSASVVRLDEFTQFDRGLVLSAKLYNTRGDLVATAADFAEIERRLRFPDARLTLAMDGDILMITTDQYAHSVELSGENEGDAFGWIFEDNYFDLLPGEKKQVRLISKNSHGSITAKAHYATQSTYLAF